LLDTTVCAKGVVMALINAWQSLNPVRGAKLPPAFQLVVERP
jgi:hypothetical protein